MILLGLVLLFVAVPFAELYVIIKVADQIGAPLTILILAADSLLGAWLMRSQGRAVWKRFNEAVRAGAIPHREIIDGVMVIFGGAFLITPGFLTDVVGILLLLPPSRAILRRLVQARLQRRAVAAAGEFGSARVRRPPPRGYDVDGTATEHDAGRPPDTSTRRLER